jgi:hypothetical protein
MQHSDKSNKVTFYLRCNQKYELYNQIKIYFQSCELFLLLISVATIVYACSVLESEMITIKIQHIEILLNLKVIV